MALMTGSSGSTDGSAMRPAPLTAIESPLSYLLPHEKGPKVATRLRGPQQGGQVTPTANHRDQPFAPSHPEV